jgi:ATP-binding cassette subfamily B multidrug efflux pump
LPRITPGDFVAFISYLGLLTWPMMALGWVTNLIQRGRASLDRLDGIFRTLPELAEAADAIPISGFATGLTVQERQLCLRHRSGRVLDRIDLRLEKGQTLGVVGPPGSGKTTLMHLLMRLYDVIVGQDLHRWDRHPPLKIEDLRSLMSISPQEPFLFAGTVRDNITFGSKAVKDADLRRVTRLAALDEHHRRTARRVRYGGGGKRRDPVRRSETAGGPGPGPAQ